MSLPELLGRQTETKHSARPTGEASKVTGTISNLPRQEIVEVVQTLIARRVSG